MCVCAFIGVSVRVVSACVCLLFLKQKKKERMTMPKQLNHQIVKIYHVLSRPKI